MSGRGDQSLHAVQSDSDPEVILAFEKVLPRLEEQYREFARSLRRGPTLIADMDDFRIPSLSTASDAA